MCWVARGSLEVFVRDRVHVQIFRDWMSTKAHLQTPGDCQSSVAPELTRSLPPQWLHEWRLYYEPLSRPCWVLVLYSEAYPEPLWLLLPPSSPCREMGEGREAVVQLGRRRCRWTVVIAIGWLSQKVPWQRALQCSEGRCSLEPLVPAGGQYMLLMTPQYKHTYTSMTWKWLRDPQYCRNTWRTNCTLTFRVSFSFLQRLKHMDAGS